MKRTRLISILLCLGMLAGLFQLTACGKQENVSGEGDRHIVVTYFYGENLPRDIDLVEDAINEHLRELGTDLSIEYYPMSVYSQNYTTVLMTDPIDLMCVAFGSSPLYYAEMEMIQPISQEELERYCPDILKMNEDYELLVRDAQGTVIGIATREIGMYNGGCYLIRQSDLEAVGLAEQYPDGKRVTYDDLALIFARLKEQFPNSYPIGSKLDESSYCVNIDTLGSNRKASGVLDFTDNGMQSTRVVNYYETDAYLAYCRFMAQCLENGWLDPEAETSTNSKNVSFTTGAYRGIWLNGVPSLRDSFSSEAGEPCVRLQMVDASFVPPRSEGITWSVSGTTEKNAAVLEFMNLFWTDKKLMNLVQWGIEGTHFKMIDEAHGIIDFADGVTAENSGYYMGGGFYGDKRFIYTYLSTVKTLEQQIAAKEEEQAAMTEAAGNPSPAGNFSFDSSEYNITIKNIESVIDRYANIMALGGYTEELHQEFISALRAAGIDEVIAAKQAQLDTYLKGAG